MKINISDEKWLTRKWSDFAEVDVLPIPTKMAGRKQVAQLACLLTVYWRVHSVLSDPGGGEGPVLTALDLQVFLNQHETFCSFVKRLFGHL